MDALPHHLSLFAHVLAFSSEKGLLSRFFNFEVQVDWNDWVLLQILSRLKMLIGSDLRGLKQLEHLV